MAGCSHDCANCSEKCSKESMLAPQNKASNVKHVIGIVSGKGGVGKSLVTSLLAVTMKRRDQQYDKVQIINEGERYATTVAEAEEAGFRRAYRWHGNN